MMLRMAVEVASRVCGAGCLIFYQTVDRLPSLTSDRSLASHTTECSSACLSEILLCFIQPLFVCTCILFSAIHFFDVMLSSL